MAGKRRQHPAGHAGEVGGDTQTEFAGVDLPCCGNCIYWFDGMCKRFPPSFTGKVTENGPMGVFPLTVRGDICGEHPKYPIG